MAPSPPALPVARLVDYDAIDPGAEGGLTPEARQGAEDSEEDLLGQVQRLVAVPQEVQSQRENHALMLGYELGARRLVPRCAASDKGRFAAVDFRPAEGASVFHGVSRKSVSRKGLH